MADNIIESLIKLIVDRSGAQQGKKAFSDLRAETRGLAVDVRQTNTVLKQQATLQEKELQLQIKLAVAIARKRKEQETANKAAKEEGKISVGRAAGRLAQVAGGVSGVVGGASISEPLHLIGDFVETVSTLGPVAAVGSIALGGLGLVLKRLQEDAEKAAEKEALYAKALADHLALGLEVEMIKQYGDLAAVQSEIIKLTDEQRRGALGIEQVQDQFTRIFTNFNASTTEFGGGIIGVVGALGRGVQANQKYIDTTTERALEDLKAKETGLKFLDTLKKIGNEGFQSLTNLGTQVADALKKAADEEQKRNQERVGVVEKYNADVTKLEQNSLEQQSKLLGDYNQKLVDIADAAAASAEKALADLQSKRAELSLQLQRDEASATLQQQAEQLDAQINFQRDEARAARDHARDLKRIREDAQDSELQLIADRDFQGLFFARRDTNRRIKQANEDYASQRQERAIAFREQQADAAAAFERERQARLAKYQQDLADAQAQYNMEQAAIADKQARDLQALQDGYNKQRQAQITAQNQALNTARMAAQEQLNLISQTEAAKSQIFANSLQQAQQLASQVVSTTASAAVPLPHYAAGGFLGAGRRAIVNEPGSSGREGFRNRRGMLAFPGFGMFTPLTSGNVSRGTGKTINFSPTFNISGGGNPDLVARRVEQRVMRFLEQVTA